MNRYKNIAYLTPFPFKDTGNIVEYFSNRSQNFFLYLYPPSYKNRPTIFELYSNGKMIKREKIWYYKGGNKIFINFFYFYYFLYFLLKYKIKNTYIIFYYPLFLLLNSLINIFLKNEYVFWIWDYFPDKKVSIKIYRALVSFYNNRLRFVIYLSPMIKNIYVKNKPLKGIVREVVSFGIKKAKIDRRAKKNIIGYIGNLRPGQGLENLLNLVIKNKQLKFELIGDGPSRPILEKFVEINKLDNRVKFFGFVNNNDLLKIVKNWEFAVALYSPDKRNPTLYTDPGKVKLYIELGIPVIMSEVSYIYKKIIKYNAGIVIKSEDLLLGEIIKARNNYKNYETGVLRFQKKYSFNEHYDNKFSFLLKNEK